MRMREGTVGSVVMKFGGTSVADSDAIGRLLSIVQATRAAIEAPPVVVVSATSGTTDQLLALASDAQCGTEGVNAGVDRVLDRHLALARTLTSGARQAALCTVIQ